ASVLPSRLRSVRLLGSDCAAPDCLVSLSEVFSAGGGAGGCCATAGCDNTLIPSVSDRVRSISPVQFLRTCFAWLFTAEAKREQRKRREEVSSALSLLALRLRGEEAFPDRTPGFLLER